MTTAQEILMRQAEATKVLGGIMDRFVEPLVNRTFEMILGPKRRRWDQYGAYHRRQVKKWRKRQPKFTIAP